MPKTETALAEALIEPSSEPSTEPSTGLSSDPSTEPSIERSTELPAEPAPTPTAAPPAGHAPRAAAPTTRQIFEAADPDLWDVVADALIAQDPWPEENEPDPLGALSMRTYRVTDVRAGEGVRLAELSVTTEEHPAYWIADRRAAELFELGDVFGFGWSDDETFVWPPERRRQPPPAA